MISELHNRACSLGSPALSVVLVAVEGYEIIQRSLAHLRRQSIAGHIELLIMAPAPQRVVIPPDVHTDFQDVRVIDVGNFRHMGKMRAEGIRHAHASFVAMAEDHCYANQVWAETLLAHLHAGADAAGPRIDNANPGTAISWAAYLMAYAPWSGDGTAHAVNMLPGHNSSYRRNRMVAFGAELDDLMASEVVAHWALREQGCSLIWEPRARCRHVNVTDVMVLASSMFHHSRMFGALRGRTKNWIGRWSYLAAIPFVPVVRLKRLLPAIRAIAHPDVSRARVFGILAVTLPISAAGEAMGLAFGPGRSALNDWHAELDRKRFLRPEDEHLVAGASPVHDSQTSRSRGPSRTEPVRIGVVGCGKLAQEVHLPLLARCSDAIVVALADPAQDARLASAAIASMARTYADPADLMHDEQVEAVLICAPTDRHAELAVAAFSMGKHLYVEKPIATTLTDALRVIDAWQNAGTLGMVGYNYRQHPGYIAIRHAVVRGDIGNVISVRVTLCTAQKCLDEWRQHRRLGGGVLLDLASHEVDLIHFVLGEPIVNVNARVESRESEDDMAFIQAQTESGVAVHGFFSSSTIEEAGMEVYGDRGKISLDRYGDLVIQRRGASAPGPLRKATRAFAQWRGIGHLLSRFHNPWHEPSFGKTLTRFVAGVRVREQVSPNLYDGLQSLQVLIAAEASAMDECTERVVVSETAPLQVRHVP